MIAEAHIYRKHDEIYLKDAITSEQIKSLKSKGLGNLPRKVQLGICKAACHGEGYELVGYEVHE